MFFPSERFPRRPTWFLVKVISQYPTVHGFPTGGVPGHDGHGWTVTKNAKIKSVTLLIRF